MARPSRSRARSFAILQRDAVERLKESLFGADPYIRQRYIRDFHKEFESHRRRVSWERVVSAASRADVVFVGDYHALPSCQHTAARLLDRLARVPSDRPLVLALEMVFGRHQRLLDRYQAGVVGEDDFLRRIRYEQEWGYPWGGYRDLLGVARDLSVRVVAADAEPRGGMATIRRRDAHAARRIASLFSESPHPRVLVLFGESHLAASHLPARLQRAASQSGVRTRQVIVVQNVEPIYWRLAEKGQEQAEAVEIAAGKYAVFNASPLAKYEAYRQTLDRWRGDVLDDGRPDLTPTVHHLIDLILDFLRVDPYRQRTRGRVSPAEYVVDTYPDVIPVEDSTELSDILRSEGVPEERLSGEGEALDESGSCFVPETGAIYVSRFDLGPCAEDAARFVRWALSPSRLERTRMDVRHSSTDARLFEEATVYLGSKIVDPARLPAGRAIVRDLPSATGRVVPDEGLLSDREDARALGEELYEGFQSGLLDRSDLRTLFRADLGGPHRAKHQLESIIRKLHPDNSATPRRKK